MAERARENNPQPPPPPPWDRNVYDLVAHDSDFLIPTGIVKLMLEWVNLDVIAKRVESKEEYRHTDKLDRVVTLNPTLMRAGDDNKKITKLESAGQLGAFVRRNILALLAHRGRYWLQYFPDQLVRFGELINQTFYKEPLRYATSTSLTRLHEMKLVLTNNTGEEVEYVDNLKRFLAAVEPGVVFMKKDTRGLSVRKRSQRNWDRYPLSVSVILRWVRQGLRMGRWPFVAVALMLVSGLRPVELFDRASFGAPMEHVNPLGGGYRYASVLMVGHAKKKVTIAAHDNGERHRKWQRQKVSERVQELEQLVAGGAGQVSSKSYHSKKAIKQRSEQDARGLQIQKAKNQKKRQDHQAFTKIRVAKPVGEGILKNLLKGGPLDAPEVDAPAAEHGDEISAKWVARSNQLDTYKPALPNHPRSAKNKKPGDYAWMQHKYDVEDGLDFGVDEYAIVPDADALADPYGGADDEDEVMEANMTQAEMQKNPLLMLDRPTPADATRLPKEDISKMQRRIIMCLRGEIFIQLVQEVRDVAFAQLGQLVTVHHRTKRTVLHPSVRNRINQAFHYLIETFSEAELQPRNWTCYDCRRIYPNWSYKQCANPAINPQWWITNALGHEISSPESSFSYSVFHITLDVDRNGKTIKDNEVERSKMWEGFTSLTGDIAQLKQEMMDLKEHTEDPPAPTSALQYIVPGRYFFKNKDMRLLFIKECILGVHNQNKKIVKRTWLRDKLHLGAQAANWWMEEYLLDPTLQTIQPQNKNLELPQSLKLLVAEAIQQEKLG